MGGEQENERWSGRSEERLEDAQNPLVHIGPHPDEHDAETDERADERAEVIEPDGSATPRRSRGTSDG